MSSESEGNFFWKMFGSVIVSVVALLIVTFMNYLNGHIEKNNNDISLLQQRITAIEVTKRDYPQLETAIKSTAESLILLQRSKEELKEKLIALEQILSTVKDGSDSTKQRLALIEQAKESLKVEISNLQQLITVAREDLKDTNKALQDLRDKTLKVTP